MTGRLWRRSGSAAAVVLAALTLAPAPSAWAAAVITVDQPRTDAALTSSSVTISGSVVSDTPLLRAPKSVTLAMKGQAAAPVDCTDSPCPFSWPLKVDVNGPYDFTVAATDASRLLGGESDPAIQKGHFSVAAPPRKPVLNPATVTDGRTVELSWARNTEADMLYYAIFRKDPAGSKFLQIGGRVDQPKSGATVTFTDTTTTFLGGNFAYQVVAVRQGATGTAASEVTSDPSVGVAAAVPPPPTTTTAAPLPGTPAAGPTTTAKPGPPNGVDLSGFLSARSGSVSLPPITVPEPPDPGFQGTLPFGARPPGDDVEEGDAEAVPPTVHRSTSIVSQGAGRPLVPIAGGLVLLLLATHMRLLNRRIKPAAEGDLPVDLALPAPPPPVPPTPQPRAIPEPQPPPQREPAAEPRFYDVLAEEADWAPPPPEPDPEEMWAPEPELEPELEDLPPELDDELDDDELDDDELDEELGYDLGLELDTAPDTGPGPGPEPEPEPVAGEEEIEVVDVVAPDPRRLVRSGSR